MGIPSRVALLVLLILPASSLPLYSQDGSTIARLSFWVPPERVTEFEAAYEDQALPILKKHGLVVSAESGRATVDSVFSRLFEVEAPGRITAIGRALQDDSSWQDLLQRFGAAFLNGTPVYARLQPYRTVAGGGRSIKAGDGIRQRLWQSLEGG